MVTESRSRRTQYDPAAVAYDQTQCGICWEKFKVNDKIILLACKHIFHADCEKGEFTRCPYDETYIFGREEYLVPTGMPISDFIAQLANLNLDQAAVDYNDHVVKHVEDTYKICADNDLGTAYLTVDYRPPEDMGRHPRFPAVLKKANDHFLRKRIKERNQTNCLMRPFYAYRETFGLEGNRFKELCEDPDYSNPEVLEMRREYTTMSSLVKRTIAVGAVALLYFVCLKPL